MNLLIQKGGGEGKSVGFSSFPLAQTREKKKKEGKGFSLGRGGRGKRTGSQSHTTSGEEGANVLMVRGKEREKKENG